MNQTTEDRKISLTFLIDRANQASGFKTRKTINKIGAIKPLPGLNSGIGNMVHICLMQKTKDCYGFQENYK